MKTIKTIKVAHKVNMGGILIDQPLPIDDIDQIDPFLLIHHWKKQFPGGQKQKEVGVGPHPHRGFSPVTVILKGTLHHRDSLGNDSIVSEGGVQWMNAGKGVTHSERPSKAIAENGGEFEIIQFWVNTHSKHKMLPAGYFAIHAEDISKVELTEGGMLSIVSGNYQGVSGPNDENNLVNVFFLSLNEGEITTIKIPEVHNTILYQIEGLSKVNGQPVPMDKSLVLFNNDGEDISIEAKKDSAFLLLSAEPLNEKVSQYGPFVMNNTTEIMEAIRDAQIGKMGVLIEDFS